MKFFWLWRMYICLSSWSETYEVDATPSKQTNKQSKVVAGSEFKTISFSAWWSFCYRYPESAMPSLIPPQVLTLHTAGGGQGVFIGACGDQVRHIGAGINNIYAQLWLVKVSTSSKCLCLTDSNKNDALWVFQQKIQLLWENLSSEDDHQSQLSFYKNIFDLVIIIR